MSSRKMSREAINNYKAALNTQAQTLVRMLAVNSAPGGRDALARALGFGSIDHPDRDIDAECGYPTNIGIHQFRALYERHGIAQRAVDCLSNECFSSRPDIYETDKNRNTAMEKGLAELRKRVPIESVMHRADRISGLGRYGGIVLGFDDCNERRPPDQPVDATRANKLLYAQTYPEDLLEIDEIDSSPWSPRAGLPTYYRVTVGEVRAPLGGTVMTPGQKWRVHWTRVIHLAEDVESNRVYAREKMRSVFNYLLDLRKVLGGSAEMFWKGAFPGFSLEMLPEYIGTPQDDETIRAEFDAYHNHLQRYLALEGFKVNPINPTIADPTAHVAQLINMICATLGIPVRIFMGSESGHLASTQDSGNWQRRINARRQDYLEPYVIRPTIDRLIEYKAIPAPRGGEYIVSWPDPMTISDKDRADISLKAAQTLMQYCTSGAEKIMPLEIFLTRIMNFTVGEKDAVMESIKTNPLITKELWEQIQGPAGGGRNGAAMGGRTAGASTSA